MIWHLGFVVKYKPICHQILENSGHHSIMQKWWYHALKRPLILLDLVVEIYIRKFLNHYDPAMVIIFVILLYSSSLYSTESDGQHKSKSV